MFNVVDDLEKEGLSIGISYEVESDLPVPEIKDCANKSPFQNLEPEDPVVEYFNNRVCLGLSFINSSGFDVPAINEAVEDRLHTEAVHILTLSSGGWVDGSGYILVVALSVLNPEIHV